MFPCGEHCVRPDPTRGDAQSVPFQFWAPPSRDPCGEGVYKQQNANLLNTDMLLCYMTITCFRDRGCPDPTHFRYMETVTVGFGSLGRERGLKSLPPSLSSRPHLLPSPRALTHLQPELPHLPEHPPKPYCLQASVQAPPLTWGALAL